MFINLANEFIFGAKILDIYYKINKILDNKDKAKNDEIIKNILDNKKEFERKINVIEDNKSLVIKKFEEQIKNIDSNVFDKIIKVFDDNAERIRNELFNFIKDNNNNEENKEKLNSIIKLFNKL